MVAPVATPLLTLDTSCVSALANPQPSNDKAEVVALEQLVDLARHGDVALQLTEAYERDFDRWEDPEGRRARLDWLAKADHLRRRVGGILRLDASVFDGPDVLAGPADVELDRRLRDLLRPSPGERDVPSYEDEPNAAAKAFSDIDHLVAHVRSGATRFVTLDVATILKRREGLEVLGIVACLPSDAIRALDA